MHPSKKDGGNKFAVSAQGRPKERKIFVRCCIDAPLFVDCVCSDVELALLGRGRFFGFRGAGGFGCAPFDVVRRSLK